MLHYNLPYFRLITYSIVNMEIVSTIGQVGSLLPQRQDTIDVCLPICRGVSHTFYSTNNRSIWSCNLNRRPIGCICRLIVIGDMIVIHQADNHLEACLFLYRQYFLYPAGDY